MFNIATMFFLTANLCLLTTMISLPYYYYSIKFNGRKEGQEKEILHRSQFSCRFSCEEPISIFLCCQKWTKSYKYQNTHQLLSLDLSFIKREVLRPPNADLLLLARRQRHLGGVGFVVERHLSVHMGQLDVVVGGIGSAVEAAGRWRLGVPVVEVVVGPPGRCVDAVHLRAVVAEEVDGRGVVRWRGGEARHRSGMPALLDVFLGRAVPVS